MPGSWDQDTNRERGQISGLPMGGLLSELLALEGVALDELAEDSPESLAPPVPGSFAVEPAPLDELADAPAGVAAQLWALDRAARTEQDHAPAELAPDSTPVPETHDFAIPGLLLSLTDEAAEPEPAPELEPEPALAVSAVPPPEEPVLAEPAEVLPHAEALLPHGRSNDLSNLIGAIDSEISAAPSLPPGRTQESDQTHERFVVFRLQGVSYGLHMRLVREVERIGRVTQVPGAPRLIRGLINLRGEILPLVDTRLLLELEPVTGPPSGYLLVVQADLEEPPVALLVDELGGVALVDRAAVAADPVQPGQSMAAHTLGTAEHRGRSVLLLDHRNLVTPEALMASAESGSSN